MERLVPISKPYWKEEGEGFIGRTSAGSQHTSSRDPFIFPLPPLFSPPSCVTSLVIEDISMYKKKLIILGIKISLKQQDEQIWALLSPSTGQPLNTGHKLTARWEMQARRDNLGDWEGKSRTFALTSRGMGWVVNWFEATLVWDCGNGQDSHV